MEAHPHGPLEGDSYSLAVDLLPAQLAKPPCVSACNRCFWFCWCFFRRFQERKPFGYALARLVVSIVPVVRIATTALRFDVLPRSSAASFTTAKQQ